MNRLAPSDLTVTSIQGNSASLLWVETSDVEDGFYIEGSTDGTVFSVVATLGANSLHFETGILDRSQSHFFRVSAFVGDNISSTTNTIKLFLDTTLVAGALSGGIYSWADETWKYLGIPLGSAKALLTFQENLYVGGSGGLVKWNGVSWTPVFVTAGDEAVYSLTVSRGVLCFGGDFDVGGIRNVGTWDGSQLSSLGTGVDGTVWSMVDWIGSLVVVGDFIKAGNTTGNRIAGWDGDEWQPVGQGFSQPARAIELYRGIPFVATGGVVFRWDGIEWTDMDNPGLAVINTMVQHNANLYIAGSCCYLFLWNGLSWSALNAPLGDEVFDLSSADSSLYASGPYIRSESGVARWESAMLWAEIGSLRDAMVLTEFPEWRWVDNDKE